MELMQWLNATPVGQFVFTMLVSMIPVVELRGGVPFGKAVLGLPYQAAFAAAVLGNILPVPVIIIYVRRVLHWMRRTFPKLGRMVDSLERKAHSKGQRVTRYQSLGLYLLVAIPVPGTGAWMGALAAAFLDLRLRKAMPSIVLGVITAGLIMTGLTALGVNVFS